MNIFQTLESEVRSYCRAFPVVFEKGEGCYLIDEHGKKYIDFFSGAGSLNYGHNPPHMRDKIIDYIQKNGIIQGLDMATTAKREFLTRFNDVILIPRDFEYKIQFPGPAGNNAVEAALKLARKETSRRNIIFFINAFHGMTLGALAVTYNPYKRAGAGVPLNNSVAMPFDVYAGETEDTIDYMEQYLKSCKSPDIPAAVILETIQGEGGVNVADVKWLQRLELLAKKYEMLIIVDDIQMGCGRTGTFFSFESAGIKPDMICLSKSLTGYGLPLSVLLIKPELDIWNPGEHNGTFRGSNLSFVTATEALTYWETDEFSQNIIKKSEYVQQRLNKIAEKYPDSNIRIRGRGLIWGIDFGVSKMASKISGEAFKRGMIIETSGTEDNVLKLMPPLIIDQAELESGLNIIEESISVISEQ